MEDDINSVLHEYHTDPVKGGHAGRDSMLHAIGILFFERFYL